MNHLVALGLIILAVRLPIEMFYQRVTQIWNKMAGYRRMLGLHQDCVPTLHTIGLAGDDQILILMLILILGELTLLISPPTTMLYLA